MDLRERTRQGLTQEHKQFDLDSFGEIMDNFIHESRCGLLVTKEEGEKDFHVQGAGCGAVVDFLHLPERAARNFQGHAARHGRAKSV